MGNTGGTGTVRFRIKRDYIAELNTFLQNEVWSQTKQQWANLCGLIDAISLDFQVDSAGRSLIVTIESQNFLKVKAAFLASKDPFWSNLRKELRKDLVSFSGLESEPCIL